MHGQKCQQTSPNQLKIGVFKSLTYGNLNTAGRVSFFFSVLVRVFFFGTWEHFRHFTSILGQVHADCA